MSFIVHESDAKELIVQIEETSGQNKLDVEIDSKRHRPLRSFSSAIITGMSHMQYQQQQQNHSTRTMRAALLFLFQDINFKLFKELSAETTILSGLEKEFLRYDEIGVKYIVINHSFILMHTNMIDSKELQIWCFEYKTRPNNRRRMVFEFRSVNWLRKIIENHCKTC